MLHVFRLASQRGFANLYRRLVNRQVTKGRFSNRGIVKSFHAETLPRASVGVNLLVLGCLAGHGCLIDHRLTEFPQRGAIDFD